jgi:hypothetical protein
MEAELGGGRVLALGKKVFVDGAHEFEKFDYIGGGDRPRCL